MTFLRGKRKFSNRNPDGINSKFFSVLLALRKTFPRIGSKISSYKLDYLLVITVKPDANNFDCTMRELLRGFQRLGKRGKKVLEAKYLVWVFDIFSFRI